jgi:hypothetical protein
MNLMLWLIMGGLGVAAASLLFKKRKLTQLSNVSDDTFLTRYESKFDPSGGKVLEGRRFIAKHLGLPWQKLSPEQRFVWLSQFTGFVAEYQVGMGDLEDELGEMYSRAGLKAPAPFPATVGEFINEMVKANWSPESEAKQAND